MNPEAKGAGFLSRLRGLLFFQPEPGGISVAVWAVVALLNFSAQIIFRHHLAPGEFGTLNTALGIAGLLSVPVVALSQAFACYLAQDHPAERRERVEMLRAVTLPAMEAAAWIWGVASIVITVAILNPLLHLPRLALIFLLWLILFVSLGGFVGLIVCRSKSWRIWGWLLITAGIIRVLIAAAFAGIEPWAELGLVATLLSGIVLLYPLLVRPEEPSMPLRQVWDGLRDRDFLLYLGATFSVVLGLFLFSSADRLVAQSWFGIVNDQNLGFVNWGAFDGYHAAGLLGRSLLWGTQPLLWILFVQRARLTKTTAASLTFFWIYLGILFAGIILLTMFDDSLSRLFSGDHDESTAAVVPGFAAAMLPLGLLQGMGMFALASRRYTECFVLGGCAIGYTLVLYLAGRQPALITAYMFGGGLTALMIVMLVGIIRWGRKQP
ncbi:MAG: hypothetical protein LV479_06055 [Methylacidiphilales bacterium]|nr:hypothetical protein [Candidatus Methylacidiphilales bacterium]